MWFVVAMAANREKQELEELGVRFGTDLRLTENERGGLTIDRKAMDGILLGFQYSLVAEVLMSKVVHGEAFIDRFTWLWRGREGVSIKEISDRRFLARFVGQRDLDRVVDADLPWTFKNDLVMLANRTGAGRNRSTTLSLGFLGASPQCTTAKYDGGGGGSHWRIDGPCTQGGHFG